MKPKDGKERRRQRSATAALKREISSRFGWLNGGPAVAPGTKIDWQRGLPWIRFRDGGEIHPHVHSLSRAQLTRAIASPAQLRAQFPRALPKLVGEPELWAQQMTEIPNRLLNAKRVPNTLAKTFPIVNRVRYRAEQLIESHPHLDSLVRALVWRMHDEKLVIADLRRLEKIGPALEEVTPVLEKTSSLLKATSLELQLWMIRLAELAPRELVSDFLALIAEPALDFSLDAINKTAKNKIPNLKDLESAVPESTRMVELALRLARLEKPVVRKFLRLFLATFPREQLPIVHAWWQRWESEVKPLLKKLRMQGKSPHKIKSRSPPKVAKTYKTPSPTSQR